MRRLRLRVGPGDPGRLLLLASVDAPEPLTLGAMHVPNRVTWRKDLFYAAVLAMLGRWRRGPTMLLGDTNSGRPGIDEETPVFGRRRTRSVGLALSGRRVSPPPGPERATWYSPSGGSGFRLDQAWSPTPTSSARRALRLGPTGGGTGAAPAIAALVDP
jgi:hypothetical protein